MPYADLTWEERIPPVYGNFIQIPSTVLLWRGYDTTHPAISDRPAYYGGQYTANEYAKKHNRTLGAFVTRRPLKLLDVRFMKVLLNDLFTKASKEKVIADDIYNVILAFGICSFFHQVELLKRRYRHNLSQPGIVAMINAAKQPSGLFETPGVRIGETENDGYAMAFLKELFSGFVDGFFSPRLESPYHVEKHGTINPEIILFNPASCNLVQLPSFPEERTLLSIFRLVEKDNEIIAIGQHAITSSYIAIPHAGGAENGGHLPSIEEFTHLLDIGDPEANAIYAKGETDGKRWKAYYMREYMYAPHPECKVSPWILDAEIPPQRKRTKTRKLPHKSH
jgi:hypothetical protein